MESKNVNLIDYIYVLVKWRKLIVTYFLIVTVAAVIISLLLPKWYRSTAVIMPPTTSFPGLEIASLVSKLPISGLGLPGMGSEETQSFMAILKSRTLMERLIYRFDLINVYEKKDIELALRAFSENIEIVLEDEGQISISVLDKDPERAAGMAQTMVSALDSIYTNLNVQKARNDRVFIEDRLNQNKRDLKTAEEKLRDFQSEHGVVDIPEQTKAAIIGAAELQSQIYATEVELGTKKIYFAADHVEVMLTQSKLRELKKKLAELKLGVPGNRNGSINKNDDLFIPFESVPDLGMEYFRLFREVEVQNRIFEFLTQMYEQAKIEEAKDTPSLQVLDSPRVPLRKAKPKRAIVVLVACLFSLILTCIYVFSKEFFSNLGNRDSSSAEKLHWIRDQLKNDLSFRKKNRS
jgi:uncharacterized protein involved in exopolysaccharide biosynthesis